MHIQSIPSDTSILNSYLCGIWFHGLPAGCVYVRAACGASATSNKTCPWIFEHAFCGCCDCWVMFRSPGEKQGQARNPKAITRPSKWSPTSEPNQTKTNRIASNWTKANEIKSNQTETHEIKSKWINIHLIEPTWIKTTNMEMNQSESNWIHKNQHWINSNHTNQTKHNRIAVNKIK